MFVFHLFSEERGYNLVLGSQPGGHTDRNREEKMKMRTDPQLKTHQLTLNPRYMIVTIYFLLHTHTHTQSVINRKAGNME